MRASFPAIVIAAALVFPSLVNASELQLSLNEPSLFFGPAGAIFEHGELPGFDKLFIDGVEQETPWFSGFQGKVDFMTGPLVTLTVEDADPTRVISQYDFGPGTFTLTVNWDEPGFGARQGHYVAPLLGLTIDIRCEQELSTLDCGDVSGEHGSLGEAFVSIGPGLFDDSLASILHLKKPGGAFDFSIALDGITGNPSDALRLSGSAAGTEKIAIPVEVPEPSILSLLLLAPVLSRRFRR